MLPKEFLELQDMPEALRAELDESNKSIAAKILALFDKSDEYYKSKILLQLKDPCESFLILNQTLSLHLACLGLCYLHKAKTKMKVLHIFGVVLFLSLSRQ